MDRDSAVSYVHKLLATMLEKKASDLYITADAAPSAKVDSEVVPLTTQPLNEINARMLVRSIMNDRQLRQFEEDMECNFSISLPGKARFRVNAFTQRGCSGMVLRHIPTEIPDFKSLYLPPILRDIAMTKRGLVIIVGATGSGKSTTLASMVDYRNQHSKGHIVTIEDPIEFVHQHKGCLITQREIGVDTASYEIAMKNTLRQAPDVILLGEIRDRAAMDYAIAYAETGHLCLSTLHANSTNQALDRIINFFPEERRHQLLMDLSLNLKSVVSQRLVRKAKGEGRLPAVEVMINTPLMADLILKGDVPGIKDLTSKSREHGMRTFDQALFDLIEARQITVHEGLRHADSQNDLRLKLKLQSRFAKDNDFFKGLDNMAIEPMENGK
ncbi:MAG TPA: PilT/PilU family type 4a pilus ATPase [Candidatus Thiothrix moscowensis]|uniref:PilT/PilU family type 4a pilus ATPase n=1 Tax=unclassified Thiothrix TaxID=2636184 RepID=UPI0025ED0CF9|nr:MULTISPECIES: PilT/PilU family type 4a pilus ATPase [unclassified Thiothrix]HRJ51898.1 PilT/PilU family type 4a pilus ATPase [Candidatus Thiothrix moscowensis]HRJ92213.1 PilT/PilU family type 4a pilus ATPase [Candidatus Thiothrix moscowensis]